MKRTRVELECRVTVRYWTPDFKDGALLAQRSTFVDPEDMRCIREAYDDQRRKIEKQTSNALFEWLYSQPLHMLHIERERIVWYVHRGKRIREWDMRKGIPT